MFGASVVTIGPLPTVLMERADENGFCTTGPPPQSKQEKIIGGCCLVEGEREGKIEKSF